MFYSETLLQKNGPLARIWLSANQERKLSKQHILQSNLSDSCEQIMKPSQAPMALRLCGQLLFGVVRVYKRQAGYLLDDCNEALMKIKMAFRSSGNNDIPAANLQANPQALVLPDRYTPNDIPVDLAPFPDLTFLGSQVDDLTATPMGRRGRANPRDINLQEDFNNSQFLQDSGDKEDGIALGDLGDLDLDLRFDMDLDELPADGSLEIGRDAPAAGDVEDDMLSDLGLHPHQKDLPNGAGNFDLENGVRIADDEGDIQMGDDDFQFTIGDQSALPGAPARPDMSRARISESPLSDVDEDDIRQGELEYSRANNSDMYEPMDETSTSLVRQAPHRAKKRKVLQPDAETMLSSNHIREQQAQHDNILKPQSFLPRDPYLLALMEMQKNNTFVTSIILDGRSSNWAPELRGLLSLDAIRRPNDLKRKRDSGIADMDSDQEAGTSKSPRLNLGEDPFAELGSHSLGPDGTILEIPGDEGIFNADGDDRPLSRDGDTALPAFDDTMAPLVYPADSGPVSRETTHAVHLLRDIFGPEAEHNADKRKKASVVFQEVLPERTTSKARATKMFFECLVLATKDAIKVEQPEGSLSGPIRVRGKRGLWGAWAEREAGGEIAHQEQNEPEPAITAGSAAVAVEA